MNDDLKLEQKVLDLIASGELNDDKDHGHLRFNRPDREGLVACLDAVSKLFGYIAAVADSWERDSKALPPDLAKLYAAHAKTLRKQLW